MIITNKIILILLIMMTSLLYSQKLYSFDYMMNSEDRPLYSNLRGPLNYKRLINSKDNSYVLYLPAKVEEGKIYYATLRDNGSQIWHTFSYLPTGKEGLLPFVLRHKQSKRLKIGGDGYRNFQVRKIADMIYEVTAEYGRENKKISLKVNLVEHDDDLTYTFLLDIPGNIEAALISELKKHLDSTKNYFINENVHQYIPGVTFYEKVEEPIKIDFRVDLSNNRQVLRLMKKQKK